MATTLQEFPLSHTLSRVFSRFGYPIFAPPQPPSPRKRVRNKNEGRHYWNEHPFRSKSPSWVAGALGRILTAGFPWVGNCKRLPAASIASSRLWEPRPHTQGLIPRNPVSREVYWYRFLGQPCVGGEIFSARPFEGIIVSQFDQVIRFRGLRQQQAKVDQAQL